MAARTNLRPVLKELHDTSTDPEEQKYYKLLHLIITEEELPMNQSSLNALFRRNAIPQRNGLDYHIGIDVLFPLVLELKPILLQLATQYPDATQQRNILRIAIQKLTGEGQKSFENRGVKFLEFLSIFLRKNYTPKQLQRVLDNSQLYTYLLTFNKDWRSVISSANRRNRNALFEAYINTREPFIQLLVTLYNEDKHRAGLKKAQELLQERLLAGLPSYTESTPDILRNVLEEYIGKDVKGMNFIPPPYTDALGESCTQSEAIKYVCSRTGKSVLFCPETITTYGPSEEDPTNSLPDVCSQLGGKRKTRRRKTRKSKTSR